MYSTLDGFLPNLNLRGLDAPYFALRVNRSRPSRNQTEVLINRLTLWSIVPGQNVTIFHIQPFSHTRLVQYAAHINLDINAVPANSAEFGNGLPAIILYCLVDLAIEIAE